MPCCYVCTVKLDTESTQVCSSITPHSDTPFAQKIAEMLGEEFVAIVTPADQVCPKCTSLLIHLDKVETEGKLIQKLMLSKVQKKYGMLPPDQAIQDVEIANGHLVTKEQLNQGQHKVPNGWTEGVSSTATTTAVVTPIKTPLKLFKTQQLLEEQQQQQLQQQKQQQQKFNDKAKIYQCGICEFQSKDLSTVRLHMNIHKNKKALESPIINEATATSLTLKPKQKKQLYRCQVCSYTYNTRNKCIEHIQKEHKKPTTSNSNEVKDKFNVYQIVMSYLFYIIFRPQKLKEMQL
ncbi:zinc finger protein 507-like [Myzus persicae]|uniref:zinc finger protein 507-like n=1 Tax=Myzus persicae TaxID=13164 RepID=UPI000B930139|nr:zinc finger protein 507-like [Myzus persicae]